MFEANFLTVLLVPNYEKPIETSEDVLESGKTILVQWGIQERYDARCGHLRDLDEASRQNLPMADQLCLRTISAKV